MSSSFQSSSTLTSSSKNSSEQTNQIITFTRKNENKNTIYTSDHPYVIKLHGNTIPSGLYPNIIKEIFKNTEFTLEEYRNGELYRKGSHGNYGGFVDLIIDESPSIRFGSLSIDKNISNESKSVPNSLFLTLSFYDNFTNVIKTVSFTDDDILSYTYTIISRENIKEVIYSSDILFRPLATMGVKPIKVKNTDLNEFLSLKQPKIENYQSNMLVLDNNIIKQCNLNEIVSLFELKTVQGKRHFSTLIRTPLIDLYEIKRRQKIVDLLSTRNLTRLQEILPYFPDMIKTVKRIENGRISLKDIVFIYQILLRKDYMFQTLCEMMNQNKISNISVGNLFKSESGSENIPNVQSGSLYGKSENIKTVEGLNASISLDQLSDLNSKSCNELKPENIQNIEDCSAESDCFAAIAEDKDLNIEEDPESLVFDEIIHPLRLVTFDQVIQEIQKFIDIENVALLATSEQISNLQKSKNQLIYERNKEVNRITQLFDIKSAKKLKVDNFTIRITRKEYNQKMFKENRLVERSVLKAGVVFTSKTLSDLEKKDIELRQAEIAEEKKIIAYLNNLLKENVNGLMAFNTVIAMIDTYSAIATKLTDPDWCLPFIDKENEEFITKNLQKNFENKGKSDRENAQKNEQRNDRESEQENQKTPQVNENNSNKFIAKNAFHPLVPECVKNDINFSFSILTGPNTAGKSTFLRTIALITILGQMGCCVPAEEANFVLRNSVFIRAGTNDMPGYSTFMLEMIDIARIVRNADKNSLVLIDELGRGTSTIDGLSLTITIKEFLLSSKCLTIFATHFNNEPLFFKDVKEFICAEIENGLITYKMREGVSESLGIDVARKVGFPQDVIDLAERFLVEYQE